MLEFPAAHEERELLVTNSTGQIFFKKNIPAGSKSIQIPVWQIASGPYFCTIGRESTKLIIAR
jgi:hypothetical protein